MLRSAQLELRSVRKLFLEEQVAYCWLIKGFRRGARGWQTEMEAAGVLRVLPKISSWRLWHNRVQSWNIGLELNSLSRRQ